MLKVMQYIDIEERNRIVIISIKDAFTFNGNDEFESSFKKYANKDYDAVALDLKNVLYIDSFGISRIIKISRLFISNAPKFVLINMNESISHIFKITTFDKIFTIMTEDEFTQKFFKNTSQGIHTSEIKSLS